jgi:hypothetical protein
MGRMIKRAGRILAQTYLGSETRTLHVFRDSSGRFRSGSQGQYIAHYRVRRDRVTGRFARQEGAAK